jgi:hypothetical protein
MEKSIRLNESRLVRLHGNWLLHLVTVTDANRVQIGNNHGKINGWAGRASIMGRVTEVRRV